MFTDGIKSGRLGLSALPVPHSLGGAPSGYPLLLSSGMPTFCLWRIAAGRAGLPGASDGARREVDPNLGGRGSAVHILRGSYLLRPTHILRMWGSETRPIPRAGTSPARRLRRSSLLNMFN